MAETTAVKESSQGTSGLDPQSQLREALGNGLIIQEAQAALKRLNSPELQPSFWDNFVFGAAAGQRKQEERALLHKQLQTLTVDLFNSGNIGLLPAVFRPLKEGEASQLLQANRTAREQAFALPRAEAEPYLSLFRPYQTAQGQPGPGALFGAEAARQAPTTFKSGAGVQSALNEALNNPDTAASMLNAVAAISGQERATMLRQQISTNAELRQQEAMRPILQNLQEEMGAGRAAPGQQSQVVPSQPATPAPGAPVPQAPMQQAPEMQATLAKAQSMGLNPLLVSAILGNERSGPGDISPKDARGRFQVIPATGAMYGATAQQLLDPGINEMVGLRYIRDLALPGGRYYDRTQGKPEAVLAAYFSGPGNVENGRIIDPSKSDGNMTVAQYVSKGLAQMAQAESGTGARGTAPSSFGAMAAGPAAPATGTAAQGQGLEQLGEFKVNYSQGTTLGPKGISSINPSEAKQRSAEAYVDQAMHLDPRLIPQALAAAAKKGAIPSPARMEQYRNVYSVGAIMAALARPEIAGIPEPDARFQAALRIAGQESQGLFNPQAVVGFRDPVLQEQAMVRMRQRETLTPQAEQVAGVEARRAGEREEQVRAGNVRGGVTGYEQVAKNTLFNVEKEEGAKFYINTRTGYPLSGDTPMADARQMINAGDAHKLSQKEYDDLTAIRKAAGAIGPYLRLVEQVYGPSGAWYMLTPAERAGATVAGMWNRLTQLKPSLVALARETEAQGTQLANLMGSKGTQTEQDVARALSAIPKGWGIPDTPETAKQLIDDLIGSFDGMAAATIHARPSNDPDKRYLDPFIYRPRIKVHVDLRRR